MRKTLIILSSAVACHAACAVYPAGWGSVEQCPDKTSVVMYRPLGGGKFSGAACIMSRTDFDVPEAARDTLAGIFPEPCLRVPADVHGLVAQYDPRLEHFDNLGQDWVRLSCYQREYAVHLGRRNLARTVEAVYEVPAGSGLMSPELPPRPAEPQPGMWDLWGYWSAPAAGRSSEAQLQSRRLDEFCAKLFSHDIWSSLDTYRRPLIGQSLHPRAEMPSFQIAGQQSAAPAPDVHQAASEEVQIPGNEQGPVEGEHGADSVRARAGAIAAEAVARRSQLRHH